MTARRILIALWLAVTVAFFACQVGITLADCAAERDGLSPAAHLAIRTPWFEPMPFLALACAVLAAGVAFIGRPACR